MATPAWLVCGQWRRGIDPQATSQSEVSWAGAARGRFFHARDNGGKLAGFSATRQRDSSLFLLYDLQSTNKTSVWDDKHTVSSEAHAKEAEWTKLRRTVLYVNRNEAKENEKLSKHSERGCQRGGTCLMASFSAPICSQFE